MLMGVCLRRVKTENVTKTAVVCTASCRKTAAAFHTRNHPGGRGTKFPVCCVSHSRCTDGRKNRRSFAMAVTITTRTSYFRLRHRVELAPEKKQEKQHSALRTTRFCCTTPGAACCIPQIRTQGSYVRKCLATRDGGRCTECGVDAAGLYKRARASWVSGGSLAEKREAVAREMVGTPFEGKVKKQT